MIRFRDDLTRKGIITTIRASRGGYSSGMRFAVYFGTAKTIKTTGNQNRWKIKPRFGPFYTGDPFGMLRMGRQGSYSLGKTK